MKRIVRHSVVLGAFAILSSLSFPAFADSSSTVDLEFTFASTLTTTLSSADIFIHDITPGTSKNSNSVNLNVTTNNITGYVVSASTGDANNNSSDLIQTGITDKFSSIAASANLESLTTDDTWGYSTKVDTTSGNGTSEQTVHTEGTWSNLNGLATTSAPIYSTNSPLIADVNFRIAARASEDIEPGEYTNTINFFVVVNPAPVTFSDAFAGAGKTMLNGYYKMQDMSPSICNAVVEGVQTKLIDARDNTVYHVGKLADGNCWFKDNLALDLTNSTILNGLDANNTNADTTALGYLKGTTTRDPATDPDGNYATAGVANWPVSDSFSAPLVNMTDKDVVTQGSDDPLAAEALAGSWRVGGYYNYCAASAGSYCYGNGTQHGSPSGNATADICPSGWRMPTGGASGEYQAVYNEYSGASGTGEGSQYANFRKVLRLPLSGNFFHGSAYNQGSNGYFWSSTYSDVGRMYYLSVDTSIIDPQVNLNRYRGFSIRCIARNGEEPGTFNRAFADANKTKATASDGKQYYQMQDMTSSICGAITTGQTSQLVDTRDNKIYWVAKLKDDHCWMAQNLDHDIVAQENYYTPANTDISANWTPVSTAATMSAVDMSTDWTDSYTAPESVNPGDWYWDGDYSSTRCNYLSTTCADFSSSSSTFSNGAHGHVGNLYNWTAAIASNDSSSITTGDASSSICPAGWRLPTGGYDDGEFAALNAQYGNSTSTDANFITSPLYFVRGGAVDSGSLFDSGVRGYYWSSTVLHSISVYSLNFDSGDVYPSEDSRGFGLSVRCIAR